MQDKADAKQAKPREKDAGTDPAVPREAARPAASDETMGNYANHYFPDRLKWNVKSQFNSWRVGTLFQAQKELLACEY